MSKRIRAAVFGTGFMGRVHLEALRRTENVDVAGIAARNPAAAEKLGSGFGVPHLSTEAILRDSSIDAVHICTPNAQHFSMAKEALLAGKHVLCEKPLSTTVEEAKELAELAAQKGLRNCVCHNLRYYPMVQQMRAMRDAGDLERSSSCREPIRRTGCCTTRTGTGAWTRRPAERRDAWPISAPTGSTWPST